MNDKMRETAEKMNRLSDATEKRADELAQMVREGMLTSEEAAASLRGFVLKLRDELGAPPLGPTARANLRDEQLLIDQRLPGFKGLVVGRHV